MGVAIKIKKGKKFGRLTVRKFAGRDKGNAWLWECDCKCGKVTRQRGSHLVAGNVLSCGCHKSDSMRKRNLAGTAGKPRRLVTVNGKSITLSLAAKQLGLHPATITQRIDRGVKDPFHAGRLNSVMVVLDGKAMTIKEASWKLGIPYGTFHGWVRAEKIFSGRGQINLEVAT